MSDSNELVARNVRRFREERSLTLGELARRSGLSKQTLSKIETGTGTLTHLGKALEVPARRLLTEWGSAVFVQRDADGEWVDEHHWTERLLDETYGTGYVRTLVLRLSRSAGQSTGVSHPPGTLHHIYVIEGRLRTGPVSEPVELGPGDFIRFPGDVPYDHTCLTDYVTAHVVMTLPQMRQFGPTTSR